MDGVARGRGRGDIFTPLPLPLPLSLFLTVDRPLGINFSSPQPSTSIKIKDGGHNIRYEIDSTWSRDRNNDYRYFLIGPEITNSIILVGDHAELIPSTKTTSVERDWDGISNDLQNITEDSRKSASDVAEHPKL